LKTLTLWLTVALACAGCNVLDDPAQIEEDALAQLQGAASQECALYCDKAMDLCQGGNQIFTNDSQCLVACAQYPEGGLEDDVTGDSVQCRINHLELAAISDPQRHCPHASADGAGQCEGTAPCQAYCADFLELCNPVNDEFDGVEDCLTFCSGQPQDLSTINVTQDTVQCRLLQLQDLNCAQAGRAGCTPPQ
jgi:hypothetical protein